MHDRARTRWLTCFLWAAALRMVASPPAAAQEEPPRDAEATDLVRFEPDASGVTLLARSGEVPTERMVRFGRAWYRERAFEPRYAPVCGGPCDARFAPGEYHLALMKRGGAPVEAGTVVVASPAVLRAHYVDRRSSRALGAVLGVAGTVAGAILLAASVHTGATCDPAGDCYSHERIDGSLMAGGVAVVLGSIVLGSILATRSDEATLDITPLPAPGAPHTASESSWMAGAPASGASLSVRF